MARRTSSYDATIDSQGTQTNPTTATVMADTGALNSGLYEISIFVGCSVAAAFDVQRRDTANSGNVGDVVRIRAAAGQTGEYIVKYFLNDDERVRVLPAANITGDAECTVVAERVV